MTMDGCVFCNKRNRGSLSSLVGNGNTDFLYIQRMLRITAVELEKAITSKTQSKNATKSKKIKGRQLHHPRFELGSHANQ